MLDLHVSNFAYVGHCIYRTSLILDLNLSIVTHVWLTFVELKLKWTYICRTLDLHLSTVTYLGLRCVELYTFTPFQLSGLVLKIQSGSWLNPVQSVKSGLVLHFHDLSGIEREAPASSHTRTALAAPLPVSLSLALSHRPEPIHKVMYRACICRALYI